MGLKARMKAEAKNVKKAAAQFSASKEESIATDYLPLEGGPARGIPKTENRENKAAVLNIGRIPHLYYKAEMETFFKHFGAVKILRIARNRKTVKSKHFGFIQFISPKVAKIVEECMHNYLMYKHLLQISIVPID